ncbi:tigger transposable element-derived protein 4-like [Nematostella vectensis]|uniref:tigger transposable element-derived protein 4-like n=1 Tax=Nematostella vectensis TaxID=45351 RepID=UPI0020776C75|nr:tigger transposable element-derived protein 4-like [Nematostella vectensis]
MGWYTVCRLSNVPVSGPMLQEEALIIAEKLGVDGFTASNGWLQCFKEHYNLQRMATAGEDGDVSSETLESWNERVREITRGWKPENVWNMDQTGSFWKGLPDSSLNERGKRCNGVKSAKQRNTWAFFANSTGEKEDPKQSRKAPMFQKHEKPQTAVWMLVLFQAKSLDEVRNHGRSARAIE